jgi:hypothetical protein
MENLFYYIGSFLGIVFAVLITATISDILFFVVFETIIIGLFIWCFIELKMIIVVSLTCFFIFSVGPVMVCLTRKFTEKDFNHLYTYGIKFKETIEEEKVSINERYKLAHLESKSVIVNFFQKNC